MLDERRVEVERHLLALKERADAGEEQIEGAVELADVAELKLARKRPSVVGSGTAAAELLLGCVGAQERRVVEALAARDHHLAEGEDRLRRRGSPAGAS